MLRDIRTFILILVYQVYLRGEASNRHLGTNPLSPHDALKHHFTSLKTDLISLQQRVLKRKSP